MRITHPDLQKGDTVLIRQYALTRSFYLLVERAGVAYTLLFENGATILFGTEEEARDYCRKRGLVLKEEGRPALEGRRELLPIPEDNLPLPPIPPEWEEVIDQALVEATKRKAANDLGELIFLIRKREHSRAELKRRKRRGKRSCVCSRCIHLLEDEIADADAKASQVLLWWFDAFDTSPGDVVAGRWL